MPNLIAIGHVLEMYGIFYATDRSVMPQCHVKTRYALIHVEFNILLSNLVHIWSKPF